MFGFEGKATAEGTPLSALPDLRAVVRHLEPYLLPFQKVIAVADAFDTPLRLPRSGPASVDRALLELMRVRRLTAVGVNGPGFAAEPLPEHRHGEQANLLGALFGRDSLHMGIQLYAEFPVLLQTTLLLLASLQGTTFDILKEEEPGRIIHWAPAPDDPVAREVHIVNGWEWPNYGAIDSTPLFVRGVLRLAHDDPGFLARPFVAKDGQRRVIRESLAHAVQWLYLKLLANDHGLLEFRMNQPRGVWNQAWKDTPESYMHSDGSYANHHAGIASIEVQALALDTLADVRKFYLRAAASGVALVPELEGDNPTLFIDDRARTIRESVTRNFWLTGSDQGYLALATDYDEDGRLRPLAVRTSNMGHALRMLDPSDSAAASRRGEVVRNLFSPRYWIATEYGRWPRARYALFRARIIVAVYGYGIRMRSPRS